MQLSPLEFNPQNLVVIPHESDSYYRFKYLHKRRSQIQVPLPHSISPRIQTQIQQQFSWFYSNVRVD
ncbi:MULTISPECIES: hypothetical protein [unclassified Leptolyngbya]|uniref:hypothetical protein n=1 Tax=unclassified Leptolyngbya TaxID=2650499 RepID=UPI00168877F9|nr:MULTISPECIES: hypothetical protein [unclassified Leptolyngbya]MBD2156697.1 hypothetical protein [Leptolyngbya sp. FACHB-16]